MDWIQVYYLILVSIGFGASICLHGQERSNHNFWVDLLAYPIALPIMGRIFGWW